MTIEGAFEEATEGTLDLRADCFAFCTTDNITDDPGEDVWETESIGRTAPTDTFETACKTSVTCSPPGLTFILQGEMSALATGALIRLEVKEISEFKS